MTTEDEPRTGTRARSAVATAAARDLLNSRRLLYFFHVARLESFTTAEATLDIAQSALSRQIRQLETDLDVKLLERRGHGVELTTTGKVVYRYAEDILGLMAEASEQVRRSRAAPADTVFLAASRPFTTRYIPQVLLDYNAQFPHIHVTTFEASSGQVYDLLTQGLVDMAVVLQQPNSPKIVSTKLYDEELFVIGRAGHPGLGRDSVARESLPELDLILPAAPLGTRGILEGYFEGGGLRIDPILRFDSVSLMKKMIRQSDHCAILPMMAAQEETDAGVFDARPLRPNLRRSLHLAHLRDRRQTPPLKAMQASIMSAVAGSNG